MFKILKLIAKKSAAKKPCNWCKEGVRLTYETHNEEYGTFEFGINRVDEAIVVAHYANNVTDYALAYPVNYCPFCGRKFDKGVNKNA